MISYVMFGGFVLAAACAILGILLGLDKKAKHQKNGQDSAPDHKKPRVQKQTIDNIPICRYDTDHEVYLMTDQTYMDILMINSKDLITSSPDDVEFDCLKFAKLYKVYGEDIKIISMNFPCNTIRQQEYFRKKIENAGNEVFKSWLESKLKELIFLEKNNTTREFYLMFFSKNIEEHNKNLTTILSVLSTGRDGLISKLPAEKKHQILYKLNNKNSLVS